jgi:hypothetical protein
VSTFRIAAACFALLLSLVVPVASASAATAAECSAQIDQLRGAVATASFTNEKDRTTANAKLVAAQQKLTLGKNDDAIQKLVDFRTRIEQLNAAGKLGAGDVAGLLAGANSAIACVQSLSPTT